MSIDNVFKLKATGAIIAVELYQDIRTIHVLADKEIVYSQMFSTVGMAKAVAKFLGVKEILYIRTMKSRLNVDGSKRGYDYPRKKGEERGAIKEIVQQLKKEE